MFADGDFWDGYICRISEAMRKVKKGQYNRIKAVLAELGVTSKDLADAIHVTPGTVSNWCTNDKQPSLETLNEIAEHLNIDVRDLLVPNKIAPSATRKK